MIGDADLLMIPTLLPAGGSFLSCFLTRLAYLQKHATKDISNNQSPKRKQIPPQQSV